MSRAQDYERTMKLEKECDYLYSKAGFDFCRVDNVALQKRGVDIYLNNWMVDEKAAIHCWDRDLQTYCFECSTLNNKNKEGWLFQHNSLTTHYSLVYVRATDEELNNITNIEILVIPKKSVLSYLEIFGLDNQRKVEGMLLGYGRRDRNKIEYKVSEQIKIVQSLRFKNAPVNIIIDKRLLYSWARRVMCL